MYGLIIFTLITFTIGGINTVNVEVVPVQLNTVDNSRFIGNFRQTLAVNDVIQICGKIQPNGKYVTINLLYTKNGKTGVALDILLLTSGTAIVVNSPYENITWDNTAGYFNLNIVVLEDKFNIDLNGRNFTANFVGNTIADINRIDVDKYITKVTYIAQITTFPNSLKTNCEGNTNATFQTYFPSMLKPGQIISIIGTPSGTSTGRFTVRFTGNNVQKELFHFNPRFSTRKIVLNAANDDLTWGKEEYIDTFPFQLNQQFKLVFGITETSFKFAVNEIFLGSFNYRQKDILDILNGFYVTSKDGVEVVITSVDYMQSISPNLENIAVFSNI